MRTLSYATYYDKVYGGWIGKCIGGNIGACFENIKYVMDLHVPDIFPAEIPPNDDLDLQLLWLQVLERQGVNVTSKDLAEAWERFCWYSFNEYGYFLRNIERKIAPPVSGWFNNQFFHQSMGAPIRSEIWGMIAPGNDRLAMEYAYKDATLDHDTESVWAEQMLAAMEAEAFFVNDLQELIDHGLAFVPDESSLKPCIQCIRQLHAQALPWQQARQTMLEHFGHPDASKAVQNIGLTILALLYGDGDFSQTQLISLNCGYDTDCTCATAGALLGILGGVSAIPEDWRQQARNTFVIGIDIVRPSNLISDLATDTCRVGVALARTKNKNVEIIDVPDDLDWQRIDTHDSQVHVTLGVDYLGLPGIGYGETKELEIILTNQRSYAQCGCLLVHGSTDCEIEPAITSLQIEAGETVRRRIQVRLPMNTLELPPAIVLQASWEQEGEATICEEIGLAGARSCYVIGPFWDLYDTSVYETSPIYDPLTGRLRRPEGAAHFNNYVNIERAYIDETSFALLPPGKHFNACEDKIPLDAWFGVAGPACWYLIQDIVSPDEREVTLLVGNSDAFKVWINDELVLGTDQSWFWMPYNHSALIRLKEGRNRVVVKVVRRGAHCDFSLGFARPNTHVRWENDLASAVIH